VTTFSITPVSGFPLPTSDEFPNFIQFQSAGVDLGDNAADTVDFADGLTATRGTGENANVVTVSAESTSTPLSLRLSAVGAILANPGVQPNTWVTTAETSSTDVVWNGATGELTFEPGVYELALSAVYRFTAADVPPATLEVYMFSLQGATNDPFTFGTARHRFDPTGGIDDFSYAAFSDMSVIPITLGDTVRQLTAAIANFTTNLDVVTASGVAVTVNLTVRKMAEA